ncbi:MAG: hypothetical protein JNM61_10455 [Zoogloeaceae bacterium]|nr:hypothetical protein [Zoogloeaceae bacterium]
MSWKAVWWSGCAVAVMACSSLLPDGRQEKLSPWKTYGAAKAAYDTITLGETNRETLHRLGFDPGTIPNLQILNFSQVSKQVLPPSPVLTEAEIPPGVRACVKAQSRCIGYQLELDRIERQRVGNFFADFLNFHRETQVTGWRFAALVVMVDERVVFKQWSGQPRVQERHVNRNPLGPLQGAGEKAASQFY